MKIPNRYYSIILLIIISYFLLLYLRYSQKTSFLFSILFDFSLLASFFVTHKIIIPKLIKINIRAGIFGYDIYKKGLPDYETKIAESLGLGLSIPYFANLIIFYTYFTIVKNKENSENAHFISVIFGYVLCGTFLGFVDDILELRWKHKLIYPFVFSLPLILNYQGDSAVHFPIILENILGFENIDINYLFYLYLVLLCIFCVNSINIYAGISGLETGQSLIIAMSIICENVLCILENDDKKTNMFSIMILAPYCACCLSLFIFNKVERKTFVGDTFCYFSGCVIAAAGIQGKFPIKLLFFFVPQLVNFLLSLPQLFGFVFCPRHRLPIFDKNTQKLKTTFPQNGNLINLSLYLFGDMSEQQLGDLLLHFQFFCSLCIFGASRILRFRIYNQN
jgi:UDP-N-acetylglucosamine--dolichyl-phosphate N-acetylglucosaminephosphotransferase